MTRNYIGLASSYHDSAVAIVDSHGEIVFAESTERYLQSKRAINIAPDVLKRTGDLIREYCEKDAELVMAFSWSDLLHENSKLYAKFVEAAELGVKRAYGSIPDFMRENLASLRFYADSHMRSFDACGSALEFEARRIAGRRSWDILRRRYDHHLTHAAAGCFTSAFADAACAVIDGYGENGSLAFFQYRQGELRTLPTNAQLPNQMPGSLGFFYSKVCDLCGFDSVTGEEWKVMGLAAYGKHDPRLYGLFRKLVRVDGLTILPPDNQLALEQELHELRRLPEDPPLAAADMAFTAQQVFAEVLFELLRNLHRLGISENLVLGGGCALNSAANGAILEHTPFRSLHVCSAPADDGNAIGAALLAYQDDHPDFEPLRYVHSPYLGSRMSQESLARAKRFSAPHSWQECHGNAPEKAAELLASGKIIGWIQGRAEFGPRALGNRSILADPRLPDIKERINSRVKFREEFRPFAPSILHEHGPAYFESYQESPFMERALRFRPEVMARVPGVVHEDGTGRLQTVKREWNELYWRLVRRFHEITGIPLVLNTSFNVMGKPIAHSVEDAMAVFHTTGLDALFIEDVLFLK